VVLRGVAGAAVGDDHGAVVTVGPEARRGAARRHDDEHRDLQLHAVVGHGHGEATVAGHDHALPLLRLETHTVLGAETPTESHPEESPRLSSPLGAHWCLVFLQCAPWCLVFTPMCSLVFSVYSNVLLGV